MSALHQGRFSGPQEFAQLVRDALATAAQAGWREIVLSDPDFADWPLGERAVAQSLQDWSASGRRCTLLARRWDEVPRRHARFVAWRQAWSHIIEARGCPSADPAELPSAVWSPAWVLQRLELAHSVGWCGSEPARRFELRERLDHCLNKSSPAFPASTLGL